jgi:arylsulfatase A-like enzyme
VAKETRPNIIMVMADDQGWGDVGYNGNPIAQTPFLDAFSSEGVRLDRFYAAAPVCSPTRASCLTGRHPFRVGVPWAGDGFVSRDEQTIAEVLKDAGYATGHFGKWHVGELSRTVNQSYFEGDLARPEAYSPPWLNGFDASFATESMMPTYNPYYYLGGDYGTDDYRHLQTEPTALGQREGGFRWRDHYWTEDGQMVDEWLEGDDSEIIMDRALKWIDGEFAVGGPFYAQIWFHAVHTPLVAGDEDRALYSDLSMEEQHWYGTLTAMDRQIGRLRAHLERIGITDNTILWFCSDNGPSYIHDFNSAGPFRGKKAELLEGGVRVPAIVSWPEGFEGGRIIDQPMTTSDFYPTLLEAAGVRQPEGQKELDGVSVLPILTGDRAVRLSPIGFVSPQRGVKYDADPTTRQYAWHEGRFKLYGVGGDEWELYDLEEDPGETTDLSEDQPDRAASMSKALLAWVDRVNAEAALLKR